MLFIWASNIAAVGTTFNVLSGLGREWNPSPTRRRADAQCVTLQSSMKHSSRDIKGCLAKYESPHTIILVENENKNVLKYKIPAKNIVLFILVNLYIFKF